MMKKIVNGWKGMILMVLLAAFAAGCGSTSSQLPDGFTEEAVKAQAEADITLAESEDFEGWKARFADAFQSGITEDSFQTYLDFLAEKGDFESFDKTAFVGQEKDGNKYAAVIYIVKHTDGNIKYTVGYDEDMNLVQFVAQ